MFTENGPGDHCIMLQSGRVFDLANPEKSEILVEDIAHGLAHTCRYVGQCKTFYSVAEHCVLVSQIVRRSKLAALFHDAAEAFIGDMSLPLKRLLPEYKELEVKIQREIFKRLEIEWPLPPDVKRADYSVMKAEQQFLMPAGTNQWLDETNVAAAAIEIKGLDPGTAKALFLSRYEELKEFRKSSHSTFARAE